MPNSKVSLTNSKNEPVQLPLEGFRVELKSRKPNWRNWIEGMGNGRFRIHSVKKR